jgi:hypothetical protein
MAAAPVQEQLPRPATWGDDKLSEFLGMARNNQFVTFATKNEEYRKLREIDDAFLLIGGQLLNPKNPLSANLLFRSHSSFRAACSTSMAGHAPETYALLRSCLEQAAYGLYIFKNPELGFKWLDRHQDADSMKAMKKAFLAVNVAKEVECVDSKLGEIYHTLYERTIDFGGHPNVMSVTGNMTMKHQEDRVVFTHLYLHGNDDAMAMALKTTAQVGITSLHVFQHVFPERFMLLGLQETLMRIRAQGL